MDMFYYPLENGLLKPVTHMEARSLLTQKLKNRDEKGEDTAFNIWGNRNLNGPKFYCVEDLDEFVAYLSSYELPIASEKRKLV